MHEDTVSESMSSAMASNEFVLGQRLLNFDDADCSHLHVLKNCLETYAAKFMVQEVDYPHTRARQINEVNGKGASARYSHLSQETPKFREQKWRKLWRSDYVKHKHCHCHFHCHLRFTLPHNTYNTTRCFTSSPVISPRLILISVSHLPSPLFVSSYHLIYKYYISYISHFPSSKLLSFGPTSYRISSLIPSHFNHLTIDAPPRTWQYSWMKWLVKNRSPKKTTMGDWCKTL